MVTEVFLQVSEKLKLAEKTALDIDRLRDGYRPAARRGAILFFVLSEMALVNSMYQYSLIAFLEVFGLSLKKSLPDSILIKRLKNIMDTLTFNIYNYGCTGERGERRKLCVEHGNLARLGMSRALASKPHLQQILHTLKMTHSRLGGVHRDAQSGASPLG